MTELNKKRPSYSIITEIELLSWKKLSETETKTISRFLFNFSRIELSGQIKDETIRIRKAFGIKVPDAIIAASALILNQPLLTHNLKDFKNVEGLKILDPLNLE
ncbi:MAG: type II toxin-antitoxin system VapC family toxin [Algoriphagus sp.]|nr:type II toxin-antitoxin system VapC family toxin [Algoriphagus sp.]